LTDGLPQKRKEPPRGDAMGDSQAITKLGGSSYSVTATSSFPLLSRTDVGRIAERRNRLQPPPPLAWLKRLTEMGVSLDSLAEPELPTSGHVVFLDDNIFDFADETHGGSASEAMLLLARDEFGEPADIVAWKPKAQRLAAWYGNAPLLGMEQLQAPRLDSNGALKVFADPLEWLLHERDGVVIVNPVRAAPLLRAAEPLQANSTAFGRRIAEIVNLKPPRILVPIRRAT
jgi:hypothetical protein